MNPTVIRVDSGYTQLWWNPECWAQIPPDFCAETIPDEFIFHPEETSNAIRINTWWREHRKEINALSLKGRFPERCLDTGP